MEMIRVKLSLAPLMRLFKRGKLEMGSELLRDHIDHHGGPIRTFFDQTTKEDLLDMLVRRRLEESGVKENDPNYRFLFDKMKKKFSMRIKAYGKD